MMKGRSGTILWDDTVRLGIELRKKLRALRPEYEQKEADPARRWFFETFVPDVVSVAGSGSDDCTREVPWESLTTDELASDARYWAIAPGAAWHGFGHVAEGFAMTDPNKLIVLTPGFDGRTGAYADHGIPAPVVAQYLRENRVVAEKNDLNSLLFLLTPGVELSKAGTLLSALAAFKRLHDDNAPLDEVMPKFVLRWSAQYRGMHLRDLCDQMNAFYRDADVSTLQRQQFAPAHRPEVVVPPHEAARSLVRNKVDYLPISEITDRVATTLFVVYPPGIATIVPGERLSAPAKPMLDYLKMFERSANLFPGFEAEIQGLYREVNPDGSVSFHTYVMQE
jgi:ornithine decarboxylase/arginine decarboxylase